MKKKIALISAVLLYSLANLAIPTDEAHFVWEKFPLFNLAFGFIGCVFIIALAKILGKILQKNEDYYD
ncbi:MAG: hypothetical protein N2572_03650 [Syntrophales bacterium]|nr:hypothetical protein [Syntrophales bacterium]